MRAKFAKHIAILILVDASASALGFYLFGYAFAYGDESVTLQDGTSSPSGNGFIGKMYFALHTLGANSYYTWLFQWSVSLTLASVLLLSSVIFEIWLQS